MGQPISTAKNATINYEIDKTIRHTKQAMGNIRRLSAAVVINHRKETGKDGKTTVKPLPDADMKQIGDLVREAMGYNKERGDSLSIANAPFTAVEKTEISIPIWKDPETLSLAKEAIKYLALILIAAFVWFKILQPLLKTMFPPPPPPETAPAGGAAAVVFSEAEAAAEENVEIQNYAAKIEKAREIAKTDPKAVANIIKDWMNANAG